MRGQPPPREAPKKSLEAKPAEIKPIETKPVETKPGATKSIEAKPAARVQPAPVTPDEPGDAAGSSTRDPSEVLRVLTAPPQRVGFWQKVKRFFGG